MYGLEAPEVQFQSLGKPLQTRLEYGLEEKEVPKQAKKCDSRLNSTQTTKIKFLDTELATICRRNQKDD